MTSLSRAFTLIVEFVNSNRIQPEFHIHSVAELTNEEYDVPKNWETFEKFAGVYCFFDQAAERTKYIGMSQKDTGDRLFHWLFPKGESKSKVQEAVEDSDLVVSIVLKTDNHMAPALESFLIGKLKPELNSKR